MSDPGYTPIDITPPELTTAGIAASIAEGWVTDAATNPVGIDWPSRQAAALIAFDVVDGHPVNPHGRTGRCGRNLGAWGENAAADPIVVTADGQVLLILRGDARQWAIPGGMVDPGETAPAALVRELAEETGVELAGITPQILAVTYVDDPRNTDEAWICTTVALYRVPELLAATAGSDAVAARWFPLVDVDQAVSAVEGQLYSAHRPLLALAAGCLNDDVTTSPNEGNR